MNREVQSAVERALGATVRRATPVSGGDINEAFAVEIGDGRTVFVKCNARADAKMFAAEARGLEWLREAGTLRIPRVLAVANDDRAGPHFIVLEYLKPGRARSSFDEELGRGLAALHRAGAPAFGLDHDNFIGRLPQQNDPAPTWSEFYRTRRLGAQLERATLHRRGTARMQSGFDKLFERLDDLVGPREPPARLHGDLWGGNLHVDADGAPCLIDPAVYGGHREVDLAMMRLFGGFSERCFAAYREAYPLAEGYRERVELYQLYPLLVHVNLFGGSYVSSVERALARYV